MAKNNSRNGNKDDGKGQTGAAAIDPSIATSKRKKLLIIVVGIIGLVAISVGATFALVTHFIEPAATESVDAADPALEAKKPAIYYSLQPVFVVNFEAQRRQRFLQIEVNLLLREQNVIPALELHMPAIRNGLVMLFSAQVYEELRTAEGKEKLRQDALLSVQSVLQKEIGKPGVEQVLFTNFVMQ